MLDERIAQKMVDEFANTIDFNINIMDENGTIIASADPGRIGTFHEIAWQMLQSGEKTREVFDDEHLLGTKSGVNMALEYRNSVIGIVGVTGNPDNNGVYGHNIYGYSSISQLINGQWEMVWPDRLLGENNPIVWPEN